MKEQLKGMYENGKRGLAPAISADGLLKAVAKKWITLEDAVDIIGEDSALEVMRAAKLREISAACNATIVAGVDLELNEGTAHFNLSIEDQSNISNLSAWLSWVVLSSPIRPTMEVVRCTLLQRLLRSTLPLRR